MGPVIQSAAGGPPMASLSGMLNGCTLSNNATDATNDIDIAGGTAIDSTNAVLMTFASGVTKRLDAAWAVGTGNGGLDTGSIANTTYHMWLIKRSDTGVVDALFSASATAPTMPTNYDYKRLIGSIVRVGGAIKAFVQDGDKFSWVTPVQDVAAVNPGTAAVTRTLTVPTGRRLTARLAVSGIGVSLGDQPASIFVSDLLTSDVSPDISTAFSVVVYGGATAAGGQNGANTEVLTNTSAQVRSRAQISFGGTTVYIITLGWIDTRGRFA